MVLEALLLTTTELSYSSALNSKEFTEIRFNPSLYLLPFLLLRPRTVAFTITSFPEYPVTVIDPLVKLTFKFPGFSGFDKGTVTVSCAAKFNVTTNSRLAMMYLMFCVFMMLFFYDGVSV